MEKQAVLYETSKYRCLEFPQKQSDDLFLILCGVEQCLPGYAFHSNHRPGYHLHVILSGKGELRMDGITTPLHFGQMFITKPEEDIWYQADSQDPWSYCWMAYGGNIAQRHTESAGFVPGVNWLPCSIEQDRFYELVKRVLDQPNLNRASDLLRLGLLVEYLALAIESNYRSEKVPRKESEYSADVYVEYAATYIRENFASAKISDVAAYIGIHRSYLTNIFKEKNGDFSPGVSDAVPDETGQRPAAGDGSGGAGGGPAGGIRQRPDLFQNLQGLLQRQPQALPAEQTGPSRREK